MKKTVNLWVAIFSLLVSGTASATLFDFNYNNLGLNEGGVIQAVDLSVDGIDVNVTAYTVENDGSGNISDWQLLDGQDTGVYLSGSVSGNLGVKSASADGTLLDGGSGSDDLDEGLLFSFSEIVRLDYINFDYFTRNGGDDFNLVVDGINVLHDINADNISSSLVSGVVSEFDEYMFNNITGKNFFIWADGNSDSFRVDYLKVSAVPEPSVILLLMLGIFLLCLNSIKPISLQRHFC